MISPQDRKKISFSFLPSHNAEMKKYEEVYHTFTNTGYTNELCEQYANAFIHDVKKPEPIDIIQLAALYAKMHDQKTAYFYLEQLKEKKMSSPEKFLFCIETLKALSLQGKWHNAVDFRTDNINFMQNYSEKVSIRQKADMYIALALTDCAAKKYEQALKLLKFGYKPQGRNDTKLLDIFITAVYIFAKAEDEEGLEGALENAGNCISLFSRFDFSWGKEYYEQRIEDASNGIF